LTSSELAHTTNRTRFDAVHYVIYLLNLYKISEHMCRYKTDSIPVYCTGHNKILNRLQSLMICVLWQHWSIYYKCKETIIIIIIIIIG